MYTELTPIEKPDEPIRKSEAERLMACVQKTGMQLASCLDKISELQGVIKEQEEALTESNEKMEEVATELRGNALIGLITLKEWHEALIQFGEDVKIRGNKKYTKMLAELSAAVRRASR